MMTITNRSIPFNPVKCLGIHSQITWLTIFFLVVSFNLNANSIADRNKPIKTYSLTTQLEKKLSTIKKNQSLIGLEGTKQALNQLIQINPDFYNARIYLTKLLLEKNDPLVEEWLNESVNYQPNQIAFRLLACQYYSNKGLFEQAESFITDLPGTIENQKVVFQVRAVLRQKQQKHLLAIEDYQSLIKNFPVSGDVYLGLAISLDKLGEKELAKKRYQQALNYAELSPQHQAFIKTRLSLY